MNLFCLSLEGSTDSLYEPALNTHPLIMEQSTQVPCQKAIQHSSSSLVDGDRWRVSDPCIPMEVSENKKSHPKKRRSLIRKNSTLDNEALEKSRGSCHKCVMVSVEQLNSERREQTQAMNAEADMTKSKGTRKKFQKLSNVKKGNHIELEDGRTVSTLDNSPVITCIRLGKKTETNTSKAALPQKPQDFIEKTGEGPWSNGVNDHHWSPTDIPPPWDVPYHTCHRTPGEPWNYGFDFTLPRATAWDHFESLVQELDRKQTASEFSSQRVIRSITDLDISEYTRSSSFCRFDSFRHQLTSGKWEGNGKALSANEDQDDSGDQTRSGGLGKKMKNISMTMRKKIGRNYAKALSEEIADETERAEEGEENDDIHSFPQGHNNSRYSLESLYSLNSGQSSSSGVTSGSDGFSNRDSVKLDEGLPLSYTGQFCGRARVHTDFVPSPYDTESLKLKVGDVIEIISKPPMGIWTGLLNNKVGNFKFIYVDLIEEKVPDPHLKMRTHRRSRRPRPKTLQELLERLNLEEYASSLLLNGYQTVDDLKELKEQHLVELNMTDPEHRHRLMAAVECIQEPQSDNQVAEVDQEAITESIKADMNDCPRDSGCYISQGCYIPDCSDSNKETNIYLPALDQQPSQPT
ncbi:hypothetical protein UPYG_G00121250 [Umbra pygmaea]|uniref:SAM domain-containing protein SAMSN-1 n=1 Tax=Umbra pygmaea TaxID=75934 RepID=A0ABD0X8F6_UMBPY